MKGSDEKIQMTNVGGKRRVVTLLSQRLFNGHKQLHIDHDGEIYRLSQTRQGKLILTK